MLACEQASRSATTGIAPLSMMEEFALGRWSGFGPVGAFGKAMENGGKSKKLGELVGGVPVFASLCLGIGYAVIMGWVFYYTKMSLTGELVKMGQDMSVIGGTFGAVAPEAKTLPEAIKMTLATGGANDLWIIVAIVASFLIMILGVSGGIERSCKIMIPALYVLFIALAIFTLFVPGTADGYKYIFSLDLKGLANPNVWIFAFGQCFFSLSVAGSGSVIYGSYLGKDVRIRKSAVLCALFDTSAALLAMAGTIGGTGLGQIAITYGYQRQKDDIIWICVVLTIIIVQIIQEVGMPSFRMTGNAREKNSPSCRSVNSFSSRTGPISRFFSNAENSTMSTGPIHAEMQVAMAAPSTPSRGRPNLPKMRP